MTDKNEEVNTKEKFNCVYILYMRSKNMCDVLGVYLSMANAQKALDEYSSKQNGTSGINYVIIPRTLDL